MGLVNLPSLQIVDPATSDATRARALSEIVGTSVYEDEEDMAAPLYAQSVGKLRPAEPSATPSAAPGSEGSAPPQQSAQQSVQLPVQQPVPQSGQRRTAATDAAAAAAVDMTHI